MFPNSANATFYLLSISSIPDSIGSKRLVITSKKSVVGMVKSISSSEYQTSVSINKKLDYKVTIQSFIYDGSKYVLLGSDVYKIERTYENGMFLELYLSITDFKKEELEIE